MIGDDDPGVADQHVEVLAPFTGDPLAQLGKAVLVGQIAAHRSGIRADIGRGLFGQFRGAVHGDDVKLPLGEAVGHSGADAGGRSGDEGRASGHGFPPLGRPTLLPTLSRIFR